MQPVFYTQASHFFYTEFSNHLKALASSSSTSCTTSGTSGSNIMTFLMKKIMSFKKCRKFSIVLNSL